jgi:hypothetical protein
MKVSIEIGRDKKGGIHRCSGHSSSPYDNDAFVSRFPHSPFCVCILFIMI